MFNTLGSFSVVYFTLAAVLFVLILFEKHLIKLEDKIRAKRKTANKTSKSGAYKKTVQKKSTHTVSQQSRSRVTPVRRIPNNAA